jgi:hypothetical protein
MSEVQAKAPEIDLWAERDAEAVKEAEGVEFAWRAGWRFRVARLCAWNQAHEEATRKIGRRADVRAFFKRVDGKDYVATDSDREFLRKVEIEQFARGCLIGWSGIVGPDKKPMSYTPSAATTLFLKFPALFLELRDFASNGNNFAAEVDRDPLEG